MIQCRINLFFGLQCSCLFCSLSSNKWPVNSLWQCCRGRGCFRDSLLVNPMSVYQKLQ
uniref:Uncharacterized protein n=1 Tax=Anguilla anguilla TaxID=7936 RepID=A0A0E9X3A2_ANGAN